MNKATYSYNEVLNKDDINKLRRDSIVKCDDLIEITDKEIRDTI